MLKRKAPHLHKRTIVRALVMLLTGGLLVVICLDNRAGIWVMSAREKDVAILAERVAELEYDVRLKTEQIAAFEQGVFLLEKFAREHLAMGKKDEAVYLLED